MRPAAVIRFGALVLLVTALGGFTPSRAASAPPVLDFEHGDRSATSWHGAPDGTVFLDSTIVHEGRYSGRLERSTTSPSSFSALSIRVPVDFGGSMLELRGWLRYDGVVGTAGLWQRQDGPSGAVQFDNMSSRNLHGTADWAEYRVLLPLDPRARSVTVGALLVGTGRVWADDLQLYVDGVPVADAPKKPVVRTVLETDTTFTSGSRIAIDSVTPDQIERLFLLAKVWGFLKYHHPSVVRGEHQWDFDLFRELPAVLAAGDPAAARREMSAWIRELGPVPPCTTCVELPTSALLSPRLDWLADRARLGDSLSAQLVTIRQRRPAVGEQFFVGFAPNVGNPDFSNELAYPQQWEDPDPGFRLLGLFRLWNIVEYWTPNRELADRDWDATLREFIPRFVAARTRSAYQLELLALIARVHDTHANLWSGHDAQPPVGEGQLPVTVRFVEQKAVVTGSRSPRFSAASGLRRGDILTSIDGTPVDSLVARWRPLYPASNEPTRLRDMASNLTRGPVGTVPLTVVRDGRTLSLRVERVRSDSLDLLTERRHDYSGPAFRRLSDDVAYLTFSSIHTADVDESLKGMKGARCLVIDLREYPSEFMVFALGRHLVWKPTPFVKFSHGDARNPGAFTLGPPLSLEPAEPWVECPVAILVDETTQSQAEYTTMAFRSRPGTVVVGSQTAGADGNVSAIALPGSQRTMISGIGVYDPDGKPTQGVGIVPDLRVVPTIAGIRAGRDEVLEAAVKRVLGRGITPAELQALKAGDVAAASP